MLGAPDPPALQSLATRRPLKANICCLTCTQRSNTGRVLPLQLHPLHTTACGFLPVATSEDTVHSSSCLALHPTKELAHSLVSRFTPKGGLQIAEAGHLRGRVGPAFHTSLQSAWGLLGMETQGGPNLQRIGRERRSDITVTICTVDSKNPESTQVRPAFNTGSQLMHFPKPGIAPGSGLGRPRCELWLSWAPV